MAFLTISLCERAAKASAGLRLRARRDTEQATIYPTGIRLSGDHTVDVLTDRQADILFFGQLDYRRRAFHALRDHVHAVDNVLDR